MRMARLDELQAGVKIGGRNTNNFRYAGILLHTTLQYLIVQRSMMSTGDDMKPLKEKVSITLDTPVLEKVKELAEYDDRSLSSYINIVLKEHLDKLEKS